LFARYQVESYLAGMFNPTVQLKSGGYIVIGVTEALVAIDVNSGRATKEGSIEDTALKTNLEAAEEVARQLRLRDLAGLIVIDFIDMEERRNNAAVEKRLKDKLKTDRARIQVGRISGFGLMEMSRQRLRPGMLEASTAPCPHCHGTGLIRSDDSMALQILRALEEEGTRKRSKEVLLRAPIAIVNFLINNKREHVALIEARYGMSIRIEADPALVSPDYVMDKLKTATRVIPEPSLVISGNAALMGAAVAEDDDIIDPEIPQDDEDDMEEVVEKAERPVRGERPERAEGPGEGGKKKRRRRRRRRGGAAGEAGGEGEGADQNGDNGDADDAADDVAADGVTAVADAVVEEAPKKRTRSRTRKAAPVTVPDAVGDAPAIGEVVVVTADPPVPADEPVAEQPAPVKKPTRSRAKKPTVSEGPVLVAGPGDAPAAATTRLIPDPQDPVQIAAPETMPGPDAMAEAVADDSPAKPKRKGWWSLAR
jgi:ribonuclease E